MNKRGSGILLHVTSLPSPYGIGDLGPAAYRFVDFLSGAGQRYWQILPLTPTKIAYDNSPYLSSSAFAGNTLLISPELMIRDGILDNDCCTSPVFSPDRVEYDNVLLHKKRLFSMAYERHGVEVDKDPGYIQFCRNSPWLDDYAVFQALSAGFEGRKWNDWPDEIAHHSRGYLCGIGDDIRREAEKEKFLQYMFFCQWNALHRYSHKKGIDIIGDLPIYVNYQSADVWTHPELFCLDGHNNPTVVAGVPPDYFSKTGQLWRNPLYRWNEHERTGFSWWIDRFRQNFSLFDLVRIDHFRGLVAYWEVPADANDATGGRWVNAPAGPFLEMLKKTFPGFPVIAEDLGVVSPEVDRIMKTYNLRGMKVLQFAFTDALPDNPHAPHNLSRDTILYTGTHDNAPVRGWFGHHATADDKRRLLQYLGRECRAEELPGEFIRLAMMSVADTVIIPLQDILGLGEESRMNTPGTKDGNWQWRVTADLMTEDVAVHLRDMTRVFGRDPGS